MIVGVAIRGPGIIIMLAKPNRHSDCFKRLDTLGVDPLHRLVGVKADDQGFYTHTGKYLNRAQAYRYAKRIKQKLIDNPNGALCSENLW